MEAVLQRLRPRPAGLVSGDPGIFCGRGYARGSLHNLTPHTAECRLFAADRLACICLPVVDDGFEIQIHHGITCIVQSSEGKKKPHTSHLSELCSHLLYVCM